MGRPCQNQQNMYWIVTLICSYVSTLRNSTSILFPVHTGSSSKLIYILSFPRLPDPSSDGTSVHKILICCRFFFFAPCYSISFIFDWGWFKICLGCQVFRVTVSRLHKYVRWLEKWSRYIKRFRLDSMKCDLSS